jgi:asparagine synthase (glutamine-hydrolysing)
MDEPLADPAAVALYFVCNLAAKNVKGVLSGEGADELFGGYEIYHQPLSLRPVTRLPMPIRQLLGHVSNLMPPGVKGKRFLDLASKPLEDWFIGNAYIFKEKERDEILKRPTGLSVSDITKPYYRDVASYDDITKMQYLDIHLWLVGDILLKADKMSMANSLESRVPFLDKEVFAVASKIPTHYRTNNHNGKYALRLAARRNFKDKRDKKRLGFPVPTRIWLKEEKYSNIVRLALQQDYMAQFFDINKLIALLENHKTGKEDNSRKIWTVFMFSLWYKEFFGEGKNNGI